jgi:hypothetical protein
MSLYYVGTRAQVRAALRGLELALRVPRQAAQGSLSARYSIPRPIGGGQWAFAIKSAAVALLSPADQTRVVPSLPSVRRLTPASLSLPPGVGVSDPLCDEYEYLPEERWRPVVVRARFQHSALPITAGATTLYDGAGSVHDLGTQYTRADGLTWVVQPIVTLAAGARYVLALWVKIRGAASDEKALLDTITLALETQNDTVRTLECRNRDGVWVLKNGLTASDGPIATSWPAGWRLYVPGDADGAPTGDACVLGQVV